MYRAGLPVSVRAQGQRCTGDLARYKKLNNSTLSQSAGDLVSRAQRRLCVDGETHFGRKVSRTADRGVAVSTRWEAWGCRERVHQYPSTTASSGKARARTAGQSPWGRTKQGMRLPSGLTSTKPLRFLIWAVCSALPRVLQPSQHVTTNPTAASAVWGTSLR